MLGKALGSVAAMAVCFAASAGRAQNDEAPVGPTAEQMVEVAREVWRSPDLRGCPEAKPGEILVCEPEPEDFGVESPTEAAIREGRPMPDGIPRAPYVLGLPECGVEVVCHRVGRAPEPRLMIDLEALPHALTPEEAALVFRAEDTPPATPEAASPEAAP